MCDEIPGESWFFLSGRENSVLRMCRMEFFYCNNGYQLRGRTAGIPVRTPGGGQETFNGKARCKSGAVVQLYKGVWPS